MAFETILAEARGPVGLITLNRPKALNALSKQLIAELAEALPGLRMMTPLAVSSLPAPSGRLLPGPILRK